MHRKNFHVSNSDVPEIELPCRCYCADPRDGYLDKQAVKEFGCLWRPRWFGVDPIDASGIAPGLCTS